MDPDSVPAVLQERLGAEGTSDLLRLFETARAEWTAEVLNPAVARLERRLVEETAGVRVEIARGQATLREQVARESATFREAMARESATLREAMAQQEARLREALTKQGADLRGETAAMRGDMREEFAAVRGETREGFAAVRGEMREGFATLRQEMARDRFELLKWSFLFWVGQFFAVAALMTAMLRSLGPPG